MDAGVLGAHLVADASGVVSLAGSATFSEGVDALVPVDQPLLVVHSLRRAFAMPNTTVAAARPVNTITVPLSFVVFFRP